MRLEMNASTDVKKVQDLSLMQTLRGLLAHYIGGRRALIVLAVAAVGMGLYFSWGWLAAVGLAPLLLALAPCAAMCALGLCMNKGGGAKPSSTDAKPLDGKDAK
ncbi:MAG: hypothetical protein ACREQZ_03010 [Woeseiaceae bacterium]